MEIFLDTARAQEIKESAVSVSGRIWRHFDPAEQMRVCRICGIEKPLQQFEKTSPYKGRVYQRRVCKVCRKPSQRTLEKRWNENHRERRLEIWRNYSMRRMLKTRGIPEERFHEIIEEEFRGAYQLYRLHPDYYYPGKFIEVKRASAKKDYLWSERSDHFPSLFFRYGRKSVDEHIAVYHKPLLVIAFDKDTGKGLCRKEFG